MSNVSCYGTLESEKIAEENLTCRKIVKEISEFGITQRQLLMLIYLLSLEIEDHEKMCEFVTMIKELCKDDLFLSTKGENIIHGT